MKKVKSEDILIAAKILFQEKGYKGASMTQIAKNAGVSLRTLYLHFSSKEQLFEAIGFPELKEYDPAEEIRKQTILHKALKLFSEKGYSSTTMEDITASCGYSRMLIYQYFSSKEDLFGALFSNIDIFNNDQLLIVDPKKTPLGTFLKMSGMHFLELFEDPNRLGLMRIVISEIQMFPQAGEIIYQNSINRVADEMVDYFTHYADSKSLKHVNFKLAARSFLGMLYSFVLTDQILYPEAKQYTKDQITDFAVEIFESGLTT